MRLSLLRIAIGFACLATSCAGGLSDQDRLVEAVSHFNDDVRWGRYESASAWMTQRTRHRFLRSLRATTRNGDLRNADYEVVGMLEQRDGSALVRVERSWYLVSDSELQFGSFVQRWEQRQGDWRLVAESPLRPD